MKQRVIIFVVLTVAASCTFGLGELRGYDDAVRVRNSQLVRGSVELVREELDLKHVTESAREELGPTLQKVHDQLTFIEGRALDEAERGLVRAKDDGFPPKKPVDPLSSEANTKFNEIAGMVEAKDVRRRKTNPGALVKRGVQKIGGWFWGLLPWWLKLFIVGLIAYCFIATIMWVRDKWRHSRAHMQAALAEEKLRERQVELERMASRKAELEQAVIEYDNVIEHTFPRKLRPIVGKGEHLKREHQWVNRDRKDSQQLWERNLLGEDLEEINDHLNVLGEQLRQREANVGITRPVSTSLEKPPETP